MSSPRFNKKIILTTILVGLFATFGASYAATPLGDFGKMFEYISGGYFFKGSNIKDGTITTTQLKDGEAVGMAELANGSIGRADVNTAEIQVRSTGGIKCPQKKTDGSQDLSYAIQSIDVNGVATCRQVVSWVVAIDGACGTDSGATLSSAPTNLCATGTASVVSGTGPWSWTCDGTGGGANTPCSANKTSSSTSLACATSLIYRSGGSPTKMVFDNTSKHVWTSNHSTNTVSKIDKTTGYKTDFSIISPEELIIDNATNAVWVTSSFLNSVIRVDKNTGSTTSILVGSHPQGIALDGNYLWVTNFYDNTVTKIDTSTNTKIWSYPAGNWPTNIAIDNNNAVWVTNYSSNTVTLLNKTNGSLIWSYQTWSSPYSLAFDSSTNSIWVVNLSDKTVSKFDVVSKAKTVYPTGSLPYGASFDSTRKAVWIANSMDKTISKIDINTGTKTDYPVWFTAGGTSVDPLTGDVWAINSDLWAIEKLTCVDPASNYCASIPNIIDVTFAPNTPTTSDQSWQNTDPTGSCYYSCGANYTITDCWMLDNSCTYWTQYCKANIRTAYCGGSIPPHANSYGYCDAMGGCITSWTWYTQTWSWSNSTWEPNLNFTPHIPSILDGGIAYWTPPCEFSCDYPNYHWDEATSSCKLADAQCGTTAYTCVSPATMVSGSDFCTSSTSTATWQCAGTNLNTVTCNITKTCSATGGGWTTKDRLIK